jgi:hypothetical protein
MKSQVMKSQVSKSPDMTISNKRSLADRLAVNNVKLGVMALTAALGLNLMAASTAVSGIGGYQGPDTRAQSIPFANDRAITLGAAYIAVRTCLVTGDKSRNLSSLLQKLILVMDPKHASQYEVINESKEDVERALNRSALNNFVSWGNGASLRRSENDLDKLNIAKQWTLAFLPNTIFAPTYIPQKNINTLEVMTQGTHLQFRLRLNGEDSLLKVCSYSNGAWTSDKIYLRTCPGEDIRTIINESFKQTVSVPIPSGTPLIKFDGLVEDSGVDQFGRQDLSVAQLKNVRIEIPEGYSAVGGTRGAGTINRKNGTAQLDAALLVNSITGNKLVLTNPTTQEKEYATANLKEYVDCLKNEIQNGIKK